MLLLGSQTMLHPSLNDSLVAAIKKLNVPTWLQGMCRGLLGDDPLYIKMVPPSSTLNQQFIPI